MDHPTKPTPSAAGESDSTPPIPATSSSKTSLLCLPGELRNCIYRATFADPAVNVAVTSCVFPEPALLSVCKQIRAEASPIFYAERTFQVNNQNYDSTPSCAIKRKKRLVLKEYNVEMRSENIVTGHPSWPNLLIWFRRFHKRGSQGQQGQRKQKQKAAGSGYPVNALIRSMFAMVVELRDLEWDQVERILQGYHETLISINPAWK